MSELYPSLESDEDHQPLIGHICILTGSTFMRPDFIRQQLGSRAIQMLVFPKVAGSTSKTILESIAFEYNAPSMRIPINLNDPTLAADVISRHASELFVFHDGHGNSHFLKAVAAACAAKKMPVNIYESTMVDPRTGAY